MRKITAIILTISALLFASCSSDGDSGNEEYRTFLEEKGLTEKDVPEESFNKTKLFFGKWQRLRYITEQEGDPPEEQTIGVWTDTIDFHKNFTANFTSTFEYLIDCPDDKAENGDSTTYEYNHDFVVVSVDLRDDDETECYNFLFLSKEKDIFREHFHDENFFMTDISEDSFVLHEAKRISNVKMDFTASTFTRVN